VIGFGRLVDVDEIIGVALSSARPTTTRSD
jgi:hypothetical protein